MIIIFPFLFLSLLPLHSPLGFTLQGNQEFCLYFKTEKDTAGYAIFHPEVYNDELVEFKALSPSGEEILKDFEKTYAFHVVGEYRLCAKNLEYKPKNASIYFHIYNTTTPADVGEMHGMEYFADRVFENLDLLEEGVKIRDQLSVHQKELSEGNSLKLNACLIAKVIILFVIMVVQICVLKYFVSHGKR